MWLMLQQDRPDDYVIATGQARSVRDFCEAAFGYLGLDYRKHVVVDNLYLRPTELNTLMGDPTKARKLLGWEPSVTFEELVRMMVDSDMELLRRQHRL